MTPVNHEDSPFHSGERTLQDVYGVRDSMEEFGRQVIREFLPQQHQEFYRLLQYILMGSADDSGWPWAYILHGSPGFIDSSNPTTMNINVDSVLYDYQKEHLKPGNKIGLLGIDLNTKRRNRVSAVVLETQANELILGVVQAFGNCPRYINERSLLPPITTTHEALIKHIEVFNLDQETTKLIESSDTVFVASAYENGADSSNQGSDISHRGGEPGFMEVININKIRIPEYAGNFHFNTLGNFLKNPKAGLLFIDFEKGHILSVTGTVELHLSDQRESLNNSYWMFELHHGHWTKNALPVRWKLEN